MKVIFYITGLYPQPLFNGAQMAVFTQANGLKGEFAC